MNSVLEELKKWFNKSVPLELPLTEHKFSPGLLRFASKYYENEVAVLSKEFGLSIIEDILMFKGKY